MAAFFMGYKELFWDHFIADRRQISRKGLDR